MAEVTMRQIKSASGASPKQRDTLRSLKLGRIGKTATLADSPQLQGMIRKVDHLIVVDEGKGS